MDSTPRTSESLFLLLGKLEALELENATLRKDIKALYLENLSLQSQNKLLIEKLIRFEEKFKTNSSNSSTPPSANPPSAPKPKAKPPTGRKRGGQKGHKGHKRESLPLDETSIVHEHTPTSCRQCGTTLAGVDPEPYRHQILEIPKVKTLITEHRFHQLTCPHCQILTSAVRDWPDEVPRSGFGPNLVALVAWLTGRFPLSHRNVREILQVMCGLRISLGMVAKLRREAGRAVKPAVEEARAKVRQASVVNIDETGFAQGNSDGGNPEGTRGWLWVAVLPALTVFQARLTRSNEVAKDLLGEDFKGIAVSDRYSGYAWLASEQRGICWAHLIRDFRKVAERSDACGKLGDEMGQISKDLFEALNRVRDGTLPQSEFVEIAESLRQKLRALLLTGASWKNVPETSGEQKRTARTCEQILKVESSLWTFVERPGVEPTNNAAERALRRAVIQRKVSHGTQSAMGSVVVERLLTVIGSLGAQQRDAFEWLMESIRAYRLGEPCPSLLP